MNPTKKWNKGASLPAGITTHEWRPRKDTINKYKHKWENSERQWEKTRGIKQKNSKAP